MEALRCAIFSASRKPPPPITGRQPPLTKTTCPALNIEACKESRPRVVVSICTAQPQPARRDFAIAIWSRENRTVSCFGILNAVQKRHASETTEAVLRMEYGCWRYVAERRGEPGLMTEMEPQGWRMGSIMAWRLTEERSEASKLPCQVHVRDAVDAVHLKAPPEPPTTDITTPDY